MRGIADNGFTNELLIDARNERPMVRALATIVLVWSLACGLTFASAHFDAKAMRSTLAPATVTSLNK